MRKTFRFRLYPSKAQRTALQRTLNCCCWVYNKTLETRRDAWQEDQKSLSRYDTNKMLTQWKQEETWLQQGHAQAMLNAQMRVDLAFRAFFRRVKAGKTPGYPRFRSAGRYDSFTYPQQKGNWRFLDNGRLRLSKVGNVKIRLHRSIEGQAKTLTIRHDAVGNWYACFSCIVEPKPLPPTDKVVGIDVGLTHFATLSNNEQIANPRFFRQEEKVLAKAQRRLSLAEKGTPERHKRRKVVAHIYGRTANKRRDFAHKLSRRLVNRFQLIAFEKLDIQDMQNGNWRSMNRSISDAAWRQFRQYTAFKAEEAGRQCVAVEPRGTTQRCSGCGTIVPKDLSVRTHECPHCGLKLDRDYNAALNILALGLQGVGSIPKSSPL